MNVTLLYKRRINRDEKCPRPKMSKERTRKPWNSVQVLYHLRNEEMPSLSFSHSQLMVRHRTHSLNRKALGALFQSFRIRSTGLDIFHSFGWTFSKQCDIHILNSNKSFNMEWFRGLIRGPDSKRDKKESWMEKVKPSLAIADSFRNDRDGK